MDYIQKVAYLESLGVEVHDYDTHELPHAEVFFSTSDGDFSVPFQSFSIGDPLGRICHAGTEYSPCCGTLLDDYRICTHCLEHC